MTALQPTDHVDDLDLSPRVLNALRRERIRTIADLTALGRLDLLDIRNFGQRSLDEVVAALAVHDLALAEQTGPTR